MEAGVILLGVEHQQRAGLARHAEVPRIGRREFVGRRGQLFQLPDRRLPISPGGKLRRQHTADLGGHGLGNPAAFQRKQDLRRFKGDSPIFAETKIGTVPWRAAADQQQLLLREDELRAAGQQQVAPTLDFNPSDAPGARAMGRGGLGDLRLSDYREHGPAAPRGQLGQQVPFGAGKARVVGKQRTRGLAHFLAVRPKNVPVPFCPGTVPGDDAAQRRPIVFAPSGCPVAEQKEIAFRLRVGLDQPAWRGGFRQCAAQVGCAFDR